MRDITVVERGVQRCWRRDDMLVALTGAAPEHAPDDLPDDWNHYPEDRDGERRCSYCGSLHPEDFFRRIEAGEELVPTDKTYKAYVGSASIKFYYQHLSAEDQQRFVDLYNARKIRFGYPGYLYTRPYFLRFTGGQGA